MMMNRHPIHYKDAKRQKRRQMCLMSEKKNKKKKKNITKYPRPQEDINGKSTVSHFEKYINMYLLLF